VSEDFLTKCQKVLTIVIDIPKGWMDNVYRRITKDRGYRISRGFNEIISNF